MIRRTTEWDEVKRELESRIDSIGCGMTQEHVKFFEPLLEDPKNYFVLGQLDCPELKGLFIFLDRGFGIFEVHTATERKNWGWEWVRLSRQVRDWFFGESGADVSEVQTFVPAGEDASRSYLHLCGMRRYGEWGGKVFYHYLRKGQDLWH